MPQMSPIYWSYLFLIFLVLILIMLIKIYFSSLPMIIKKEIYNINKMNNKIKWSW